jgi:hypothetical protein
MYNPEYDTIVLYEVSQFGEMIGSHAARLLPNGWWSSKIGNWEDIEHPTPEDLCGSQYGAPLIYMRKRKGIPNANQTRESGQ